MSYDAYPNCADTVEQSFVREQAPNNWPKLLEVLEDAGQDIEVLANIIDLDINDFLSPTEEKAVRELWYKIQMEFQSNTDMELSIGYFDAEDGGRGNEIDGGAFFYVSNYEIFKPKAEQFRNKVQHKQWVTWG